jgi:hypothetical protein
MMYDEATSTMGGETTTIEKPTTTRAERVKAYQAEHHAEYAGACRMAECRCSPTKAESLIIESYRNPPID